MSVLGFIDGPDISVEVVRGSCLQACSEAYGTTNASSCAFGCTSQLPTVEENRKQIAQIPLTDDYEGGEMGGPLDMPLRVGEYTQRMLGCMFDRLHYQLTFGWMVVTSTKTLANGGQVVVVRGIPVAFMRQTADESQEFKTSNYLETNLAVVDRSATPDNIKNSQLASADLYDFNDEGGVATMQGSSDWLSCLSVKTGLSKMSVVFILFTLLLVLMWFVVGVVFPSQQQATASVPQKLSIYGDLEYLTMVDDMKPPPYSGGSARQPTGFAPPLPVKMQEI
jgi:hypothetical protein